MSAQTRTRPTLPSPSPSTASSSSTESSSSATFPNLSYPRLLLNAMASTHRRSRSREFWTSLGGMMGHKSMAPEEVEDEPMHVDEPATISLTPPPSLPKCSLSAAFQCSDTNADIPPAFYPGQAIPTILTFQLDRFSSLPHALQPTLTMSLVGTLHIPNAPPRTIICVSVSLAEGLQLWARDAQQAYAQRPPTDCHVDPAQCLPGGTYSLPLTVQVPSTPRLPPSFTVAGATFAVTYALTVSLTCDDPVRAGGRVVLAEAARPFEMMPETMPTRSPRYNPQNFWVRSEGTSPSAVTKGLTRRPNSRWTVEPSLPTTAYSPTSTIPLSIKLTPPQEPDNEKYQVLVRIALVRREHSSLSEARDGQAGLVNAREIVSRWGWVESDGTSPIDIQNILLPLMTDQGWANGFSTMLNVGPPANAAPDTETISVSSTFHLAVTFGFLHLSSSSAPTLDRIIPLPLPPAGEFTAPVSAGHASALEMSHLKRCFPGTMRTLPLPIVVGSVSEPQGAMHNIRWSDLHLDRSSGREVGRMISGEGISCEDGWIVPPPAYEKAIETAPYDYQ